MSSSRPVSQESVLRTKLLTQTAELRNRRNSNPSPPKPPEKTVAEISMKDFLDFLKISYQVNEAIDGAPTDIGEKVNVDWKKLTANALLSQLKEQEALAVSGTNGDERPKPKSPNTIAGNKVRSSSFEGDRKNDCGDRNTNESPVKNVSRQSSEEKEKKLSVKSSETLSTASDKTTASNTALDKRGPLDRERRLSMGRRKSSVMIKKEGSMENETSRSENGGPGRPAEKSLKKKLNEVLQEGILDSVLPYLLPKQQQQSGSQPPIKKLLASNELKKIASGLLDRGEKQAASGVTTKDRKDVRRKSVTSTEAVKTEKKDVEVVIHVCDEIKNLKKDFRCSQKLLVSKMGYFAEVTTGQKLEDMDISVHCDVTIFDWLMRWVKKEGTSEETWPTLDAAIVIPVLMSSAFLQMDTLQEHCLQYCKYHINEIVRDSSNLGCINDSILTRLANLFSNTEIENMKDRKDKLQSKLYCKLIVSLTEPQPQPSRGHYSSISTMYRCSRCSRLILRNMASSILCLPSSMTMDRSGSINSSHVRDPSWNLTDYVRDMKQELKVWRKVYWRLWSDCHLISCSSCNAYFPLHQMSWCRYHAESAQFFSMENQRSMSFPIGRYPCCGERAYRFEVLKSNSGCQYRDHVAEPKTPTEFEIMRVWNDHKELIRADPPPLVPPERMRLVSSSRDDGSDRKSPSKDPLWWDGLELAPPKPKLGLFAKIWDNVMKKEDPKRTNSEHRVHRSPIRKPHMSQPQPSILEGSSCSDSSDQDSSSSEAGDSEESCHATVRVTAKPKGAPPSNHYITATRVLNARKDKKRVIKKRKTPGTKNEGSRFWVSKLSTRCNQDNQREFEERAVRQIESILARKTSGESLRGSGSRSTYQLAPPGGTYVKLEQEWREAHCSSHGCPGSSVKAKASNSYMNVSTSSFSLLSKSKTRGQR